MKKLPAVLCGIFLLISQSQLIAQGSGFSRADSLRGYLSAVRSCFDVKYYDLELKIDPASHRIAGVNKIHFGVASPTSRIQIDLFENMVIDRILWNGKRLNFNREHNAVFIDFPQRLKKGTQQMIEVLYAGKPIEAKNAPWDGGFVWKEDKNGKDWLGVACEGIGASLWWPNKDHLSDEPDSMQISIIYPKGSYVVSNGNLREVEDQPGEFTKWTYFVSQPINNYNVSLYIGDYVKFTDIYENEEGQHELKYHVLSYNKQKAKKHFQQVKEMMACFEKYFGTYPFWEDGFGLVETSYWGMEHQGAIAYGNNYINNEFGFDFIIIHEAGHEWYGNSLSVADHGEMWIHEAFTTYMEAVYVEETQSLERAQAYLNSQRRTIQNQMPILGPLDVNFDDWPDGDMYNKGSWMLHTLRNVVANDDLWFDCLKQFTVENRHNTVNTEQVIEHFNWKLGEDYSWFFDQYLNYKEIPIFEYQLKKQGRKLSFEYRWIAQTEDFQMPLDISIDGQLERIYPTTSWQSMNWKGVSARDIEINKEFGLFEVENE